MTPSREVLRILENLIDTEVGLYREYLKVIELEKAHLRSPDAEKISQMSEKRQQLYDAMRIAEKKRMDYVANVSRDGAQSQRISDFIKRSFSPIESKRVLMKVESLKELVKKCHRESREFGQVVDFSLNMVGGLISIFWSATQSVVRSYTAHGRMRESFTPALTRSAGLLREV